MSDTLICHHVVYWTISKTDAYGVIIHEQHYALNLAEIDPIDGEQIESLLEGVSYQDEAPNSPGERHTDPRIISYRHQFRPFVEVKSRTSDYCRFSSVYLQVLYTEYAQSHDLECITNPI